MTTTHLASLMPCAHLFAHGIAPPSLDSRFNRDGRHPTVLRDSTKLRAATRPQQLVNRGRCFATSNEVDDVTGDPDDGKSDATSNSNSSGQPRPVSRPGSGGVRSADSTDWIASAVTRRFGLAGGLAWVGFLAFGVISEQLKTRREVYLEESNTRDVQSAEEVVLPSGVRFTDLRVGGGARPFPGDLVLLSLRGTATATAVPASRTPLPSTSEVEEEQMEGSEGTGSATPVLFVDTTVAGAKDMVWLFASRPYPPGITPGLVEALSSMQAGGRRSVIVPADSGYGANGQLLKGGTITVPGSAELHYEVELKRVAVAPS